MKKRTVNFMALSTALIMSVCGCSGNIAESDASAGTSADNSSSAATVESSDISKEFSEFTKRSFISAGNTERISEAINKAKSGKEVTLAYLGGSITQGVGASDEKNCYAYKSYEMFTEAYAGGDKDKVRYINAGIAGTPSSLGIVRSQKDVLDYSPDIVFVEFAVNDGTDAVSRKVYESLVKRLLDSPSKPAVVLIFTVLESGYSAQEHMQKIGEHYDLGMISVSAAITPEIENGNMVFKEDYAVDEAHPNDDGHQMICDFLEYFFCQAEKTAPTEYKLPESPLFGDEYTELYNISEKSSEITSMGSFEVKKVNCFTYENGLKHNSDMGNDPLVFTAEFSKLMLCFRQNKESSFGKAEIIIDGEQAGTISGYNKNGWGNIETKTVYNGELSMHTVEIRMKDEDAEKSIWLLDIGCIK